MHINDRAVRFFSSFLFCCFGFGQTTLLHAYQASDFSSLPPFISASAPPLVMLVMERDEKLYRAAYNDASDLGKGTVETHYNPAIFYYGYFDSYKCYTNPDNTGAATAMFVPSRVLTGITTASDIKCGGTGEWSGNWLNYVTMSRMDSLRAVLYGGYRSVDDPAITTSATNAALTVLQRANIPPDTHAFGKEFNITDGYNIRDFTPYDNPTYGRHLFANVSKSATGAPLLRVLLNNTHRIWDWVSADIVEAGDTSSPVNVVSSAAGTDSSNPANQYQFDSYVQTYGVPAKLWGTTTTVTKIDGTGNPRQSGSTSFLSIFNGTLNVATAGIYTFACDGSDAVEVDIDGVLVTGWYGQHGENGSAPTSYSGQRYLSAGAHTLTFHQQKVAGGTTPNGSYHLYWKLPNSSSWLIVPASSTAGLSGLTQAVYYVTYGVSTIVDKTVQVQVCVPSMLEGNCEAYINDAETITTYKPTGILQRYGESGNMLFGLISGSYKNNFAGGVLRKNISKIMDTTTPAKGEINPLTGQFQTPSTAGSIINTINSFKISQYNYSGSSYNDCSLSDGETGPAANGKCTDWGNPIGEMMYEALRYFDGASAPTAKFSSGISNGNDNGLNLPYATWTDPYSTCPQCSMPFMLVLSDINPSYDSNTVPNVDSNFAGDTGLDTLDTADPLKVKDLANQITCKENLTGYYYIGQAAGTSDGICTAKSLGVTSSDGTCSTASLSGNGLGDIRGLCPEEPTKQGSYTAASVAYYGRTRKMNPVGQQNVMTYAVAMASPLPQINISVGTKKVTMVPFGKAIGPAGYNISNAKGSFQPTSAIVGFYVQTLTPTNGVFRVAYADIEQGNDNDMDVVIVYEYQVLDSNGNPTSNAALGSQVRVTTTCDFAAAGIDMHLGYTISGTDHDGPYLEVRQSSYSASNDALLHYYADTPPGIWSGQTPVYPTNETSGGALPLQNSRVFNVASGVLPATIPKDPLWLAAKYGGFQTNNTVGPNYFPKASEWDSNGDGVPDTYYYVTNPLELQKQLNNSFADILRRASSGTAASVISNSRSGEGAVYQSIFYPANNDFLPNTVTWVGDVQSLLVDVNGNLREDTNGDHALNIVKNLSATDKSTQCGDLISVYNGNTVNKYADCSGNSVLDTTQLVSTGTTNSLKYLWRAGNWLNSNNLDPLTQRTWGSSPLTAGDANLNRRYIFTFIDNNQSMVPDSNEVQPFQCSSMPSTADLIDTTKIYPYLNVYPPFETALPSYISGVSVTCSSLTAPSAIDSNASSTTKTTLNGDYTTMLNTYTSQTPNCATVAPPASPPLVSSYTGTTTQRNTAYTTYYQNTYKPAYLSYLATSLSGYNNFADLLKHQSCREINYIRGQDQAAYVSTSPSYTLPAFRSRQFDYFNNSTSATWRLGDIVYSTPTVVGRPSEGYHLLYQDSSYAGFLKQYLNRRSVVYVGANDGMVHAFNGGFYNDSAKRFDQQGSSGSQSPFALGAELWGYVPFNLLPHLFWLTYPDYSHVYYVDQKPRVFDARIFFKADGTTALDSDHVNGWGTVMVIGMRFGGGTVCAQMDKTRSTESSNGMSMTTCNSPDRLMSSAYVVMDVTNPEVPPRLLGELTFPGLGYTTSYPTVIPMGAQGGSTTQNDWYLVFGSGPAESNGTAGHTTLDTTQVSLNNAASGQTAKLYVVDLKALASTSPKVMTLDGVSKQFQQNPTNRYWQALEANAFVSDPITVDYQLNYKTDAVYFGTVSGSPGSWSGQLRRIKINDDVNVTNWIGDSILLGSESAAPTPVANRVQQPITAAPSVALDAAGNRWVFFGTGRFFTRNDAVSSGFTQQAYYGIKEPFSGDPLNNPTWTWGTVPRSSLLDVSTAQVFGNNTVQNVTGYSAFGTLSSALSSSSSTSPSGWELKFSHSGERNVGQAALLGSTLAFTTYVPSTDPCAFEGQSYLYALVYNTGTASVTDILNSKWVNGANASYISLGQGLAATPNIHVGEESGSTIFVQDSTGEIKTINEQNVTDPKSGRTRWKNVNK